MHSISTFLYSIIVAENVKYMKGENYFPGYPENPYYQ